MTSPAQSGSGDARTVLHALAAEYGANGLDDVQTVAAAAPVSVPYGRVFQAAASAQVAMLLAQRAGTLGPETAVRDVAALVATGQGLDLASAQWVVAEYALAVGLPVTPPPVPAHLLTPPVVAPPVSPVSTGAQPAFTHPVSTGSQPAFTQPLSTGSQPAYTQPLSTGTQPAYTQPVSTGSQPAYPPPAPQAHPGSRAFPPPGAVAGPPQAAAQWQQPPGQWQQPAPTSQWQQPVPAGYPPRAAYPPPPRGFWTRGRKAGAVGVLAAVVVAATVVVIALTGRPSSGTAAAGSTRTLPAPGVGATGSTATAVPSPIGETTAPPSVNPGGGGLAPGATLTIGVDLPFQGSLADTSNATFNAMQLYLDSVGDEAGPYKIRLRKYDDADASGGTWSPAVCEADANGHVASPDEVAVMGTYNSGCALVEVPILNQGGPMLMVSGANSYPGLTKPWAGGTPERYYPTGRRSYARVLTTDDYQGTLGARFAARTLHATRCYVLDDGEVYGQGLAAAFRDAAPGEGITIVGSGSWAASGTYTAMFTHIKGTHPDCLYLGGIFSENGARLLQDKVAVLGSNTAVKVIAPDGFTGYPGNDRLAASQGMYMTFAGEPVQRMLGQPGAPLTALSARYLQKYGTLPTSSYVLYGVQALQVILAAIAASNGTRAGVSDAVFGGAGIDIPAGQAILGRDVRIDPATGDVNVIDVTVLEMRGHTETYLSTLSLP